MHFIADIGGTNIRLAAFEANPLDVCHRLMEDQFDQVQNYEWDQVGSLEKALSDFQKHLSLQLPVQSLTIAIAGPALPEQDAFKLTNRGGWFSRSDLSAFAEQVLVINDFAAQASIIPHLSDHHLEIIKPGSQVAGARAVVGPGTGLGVAGLMPNGLVIPGEGGNCSVSFIDGAPLSKITDLVGHGQLRLEDVFSGQGLENIYAAQTGSRLLAKDVSVRAHAGDTKALSAMNLFFDYAAQICSDQALQYAASGGVYLVGSIMIKNSALLDKQRFNSVFCSIQTHTTFLEKVPVYMVTSATSGLAGVAAYLAAL